MKRRQPFVPPERPSTVRQMLVSLLLEGVRSAKELSAAAGIPEKEVYSHLEQIDSNRREHRLAVTPAECRTCGFVFGKRNRLTKPGKCPVCRGESIAPPLFSIAGTPPSPGRFPAIDKDVHDAQANREDDDKEAGELDI